MPNDTSVPRILCFSTLTKNWASILADFVFDEDWFSQTSDDDGHLGMPSYLVFNPAGETTYVRIPGNRTYILWARPLK